MQELALEAALVEVEHPPGLPHEVGIGRKDPGAVLPRLERVLSKPARDRRRRDVGDAALDDKPMRLSA